MGKTQDEHSVKMVRYIKYVVLGGLLGLAVCIVCLVLVAVGISRGFFDMDYLYQFTLLSCVVGSFFGGRWAIRRCVYRRLIVGILVGVVLFLIILTIGVIFFGGRPESGGIGLVCASLCGGAVSGIVGYGGKSKKKRRK